MGIASLIKTEALPQYLKEFRIVDTRASEKSSAIDRQLGVTYPPYPTGLNVGTTLKIFEDIVDCSDDSETKQLLALRSQELASGYFHFMRKRWPSALEKGTRLPSVTQDLGSVFETLYDLCVGLAPYLPSKKKVGFDGAHWFHRCIVEITMSNGIVSLLDEFYPPISRAAADSRAQSTKNKKDCQAYLNSRISKISNLEPPTPAKNKDGGLFLGSFGTVLLVATERAGLDHKIQSGLLKDFIKALRSYARAVSGPNYRVASIKENGSIKLKNGPRDPGIKVEGMPEKALSKPP